MGERQRLGAKSRNVRSQMRKLGPMLQGSVILRRMKCGKSNCRCKRGYPHTYLCVTYNEKGKTKTVYVNKSLHAETFLWSRNYKQFKALLKKHSRVNLEILKSR